VRSIGCEIATRETTGRKDFGEDGENISSLHLVKSIVVDRASWMFGRRRSIS
jgi:hypothetical protein